MGVGYLCRWIRFGGRRGVVAFDLFHDGAWIFFLGPLRLQYLGKKLYRFLLPWRSKITHSVFWLRLCSGFRGRAE